MASNIVMNFDNEVEFVDAETDREVALKDKRKYDGRGSTGSETETPSSKTRKYDAKSDPKSGPVPDPPTVKTKPKAVSFSDMVIQTFNSQAFIESMMPIFSNALAPLINGSMNSMIENFKDKVLAPVIETNKKLSDTVKNQTDIINQQKSMLQSQQKKNITS